MYSRRSTPITKLTPQQGQQDRRKSPNAEVEETSGERPEDERVAALCKRQLVAT